MPGVLLTRHACSIMDGRPVPGGRPRSRRRSPSPACCASLAALSAATQRCCRLPLRLPSSTGTALLTPVTPRDVLQSWSSLPPRHHRCCQGLGAWHLRAQGSAVREGEGLGVGGEAWHRMQSATRCALQRHKDDSMSKLLTCAGCIATNLCEEAADVLLYPAHWCWIAAEAPQSRSVTPSGSDRSAHATSYRCCARSPCQAAGDV